MPSDVKKAKPEKRVIYSNLFPDSKLQETENMLQLNKNVLGIVTIRRISERPSQRSENHRIENDAKIRKQTLLEHFSKKPRPV